MMLRLVNPFDESLDSRAGNEPLQGVSKPPAKPVVLILLIKIYIGYELMFVFLQTREMGCDIIQFDLFPNQFIWFYGFRLVRKINLSNQNSSRGHFWRKQSMCPDEFLPNRRTFLLQILGVVFVQDAQSIFKLHSDYQPTGDQPQAIEALVKGFKEGNQCQTLLGVTGSGKTFTMANVIQQLEKPTLVIAHNKTLAAQLYGEFKEFFPENAVEYFVSY